jgi:hypothetical protein
LSNPQKLAAAEARWEAAQLQAANAQRELDYAIAVFDQGKAELDGAQIEAIMAQVEVQREAIKKFLMDSHEVFVKATLKYGENNA